MHDGSATDGRRRLSDRVALPDWGKLALAGGAIVALGSVRPWVTLRVTDGVDDAAAITMGGIGGDGVATLGIAALVVAVVLGVASLVETGPGRTSAWTAITAGFVVGVLSYGVYMSGRSAQQELAAGASEAGHAVSLDVHASLFVVALGSVVLVAAGVAGLLGDGGEPADD